MRERLKRDNEIAGINYCLCRLAFGDLSFEELARSVELFAQGSDAGALSLAASTGPRAVRGPLMIIASGRDDNPAVSTHDCYQQEEARGPTYA